MDFILLTIMMIGLITLIAYFINNIFLYNKTSYILIGSIFLFIFASVLFFILELEFLAITFSMIYVGGIAVMFLFLILVVDVNIENVEGTKLSDLKLNPCLIISIISFILNNFLMDSFDISMFTDLDLLIKNTGLISIPDVDRTLFLGDFADVDFDIDFDDIIEILSDNCYTYNYPLFLTNSVDLWVLSVLLFKSFYVLLILLAFYLTIAVVVSLIFCSNTFEKFLNFRF